VFRDDVVDALAALDGPAPVLAGHSMGATVALMAAAAAPARCRGLALFEPVILSPFAAVMSRAPWTAGRGWRRLPIARAAARRRAVFADAAEAFEGYRGRGAFKDWPEIMLADYLAGGLRDRGDGTVELACEPAWEAANFAAQDNGSRRALRRLRAPAAIYRAERGSTCALRRSPFARVATVPGTGHFLPMERPGLFRDALLDAVDA
jgi:pimeloyl-ACP methyl ester carboxylesterase